MRKVRVRLIETGANLTQEEFEQKCSSGQPFIGEVPGRLKPSQIKRWRPYFLAIASGVRIENIIGPHALLVGSFFIQFPKIKEAGTIVVSAGRALLGGYARTEANIGQVFSVCSVDNGEIKPVITIRLAHSPARIAGLYFPEEQSLILVSRALLAYPVMKEIAEKLELRSVKELRKRLSGSAPRANSINITLGADPEFEESERADSYQPIYTNMEGGTSAPVGRDGAGAQIEIRPEPSSEPKQLVENIRALISQCPPIAVKGDRFPLGGHIHFGGIRPEAGVLKVLDDFLGKKLIELSGRARSGYKRLGAFETKNWGFEYRSLPSAWLHNPEISYIVLKLAKRLMEKLFSAGRLQYQVADNDDSGAVKEEYKKYLSAREIEKFFGFINSWPEQATQIINANWVGGRRQRRQPAAITFKDEWHRDIRSQLEQALAQRLRRRPYELIVFGFSSSRGDVCNYDSRLFSRNNEVGGFSVFENGKVKVGLPFSFRSGQLETSVPGTVEIVVKEIVKVYKQVVKNNRTQER